MFQTKADVDRHVDEIFRNLNGDSERNLKCYQIAKQYYKVGDYQSVIKYVNRYISTTSGSAPAHRLLGDACLGINSKIKALQAYKTSLEIDGNQRDLVLKVCELLSDPDIPTTESRSSYWLQRAENLFPKHPAVFKLKEHLLRNGSDGKEDIGKIEKLIMSEISARPTDITVRIRLINFLVETKRSKVAYKHALEVEARNLSYNDLRWYDCLCSLVEAYEKENSNLEFDFHIRKISFLERRANLSMQEFQTEVKSITDCSNALFAFDQHLQIVSKISVPNTDAEFFKAFMKHMRAQLSFHLATLALKRAKKEPGMWQKSTKIASPLLLQAAQFTMDLNDAWYDLWRDKNLKDRELKLWNKDAAFRVSQAGHVLLALAHESSQFLTKVSQFCANKWRGRVYSDVFYSREHQDALNKSHFMSDPSFIEVPFQLLSEAQLTRFDDSSQSAYPDSLHHLVWLGLAYFSSDNQLKSDFRCTVVPDLQFTVDNLNNSGPETLNQLDVDAFLYASVLCAKSAAPSYGSSDRPSRLPVSISEELCSPAQAEWWSTFYKTYTKQTTGNLADMRLKLRKGIETIRASGSHGLHVKLIISLARLFQDRAANNRNPDELAGLEARTHHYWTAAIPLLERLEKNQQIRPVPNRLFDYRGKDLTNSEVKQCLEDGRLFLACRLMKQGRNEEAIEAFHSLKSPYATFYQAMIYKKLASEEVNHGPESITSANRSQHIILLTRARDAIFLTLDRLRSPAVDPGHPLNAKVPAILEEIERQLARIDPDNNLNRNGDAESDETDTAPGLLSPDAAANIDSSFSVYNTNNFLGVTNQSTPRGLRHNFEPRQPSARIEARPSPERLDAHLRHLVHANSTGLQSVLEVLKDIKSILNHELKDLRSVVEEALNEFKKFQEQNATGVTVKKEADVVKAEDLFELVDEEDYDDISHLSQQYNLYQNYAANYRQMSGLQGTSTVTYGAPVPPTLPTGVPPIVPTPGNPMISPSFFPNARPVGSVDPNLLLYQTLGYYAQGGLPFNEAQNVPDFRNPAVQKSTLFGKNSHTEQADTATAPAASAVPAMVQTPSSTATCKPQPPNVVITSSDTLPVYTNTETPTMSVTIPPHHLRGVSSSNNRSNQNQNQNQVHAFQIPMPPQAQLVRELPAEKTASNIFPVATSSIFTAVSSVSTSAPPKEADKTPEKGSAASKSPNSAVKDDDSYVETEIDPRPDFKPIIPLPDEVEVKTGEENEVRLFESKAKLFISVEKEWKERGTGVIRVLHNESTGKVRIVMRRDQVFKLCANHFVTPDMTLSRMKNNERAFLWHANDFSENAIAPLLFCVRFKTIDEAKDFEYAFDKGREIAKESAEKFGDSPPKTEPPKPAALESATPSATEADVRECSVCGKSSESKDGICVSCKNANSTTKLGGFTFQQSPLLKAPTFKPDEEEPKEEPQEAAKPSPFASFTFTAPKTATGFGFTAPAKDAAAPTKPVQETKEPAKEVRFSFGGGGVSDFSALAAKGTVSDSFKISADFKGFEGAGSPVFGALNKPKTAPPGTPKVGTTSTTSSSPGSSVRNEEDGDASEFVPTAEFTPVVPLPDLVEVKTGEEGEKVLYEKRAKILRFDSEAKEWKEKGVGQMKVLLNEETGKVRLLMRREQVLKVCCNHFLDEKMEFKTMSTSDKALTWIAQDYSEGEIKPELLAIRFGKSEMMLEFKKLIEDTQKKMKEGRIGGKKAEEPKPQQLKPLSELFKPKTGSWECATCYIRNDQSAAMCVSCETPKPGSDSSSKSTTDKPKEQTKEPKGIILDPSLASKFNFGIPQSSPAGNQTVKSEAANVFGDSAVKKPEDQPSTFVFGVPSSKGADEQKSSTAPKPENKQPFFFGTPTSGNLVVGAPETKSGFVFGSGNSSNTATPTVPFSFDAKQENKDFTIGSSGKFEFSFSGVKPTPTKSPGKVKSPGGAPSEEDSEYEPDEDEGDHITFKPVIPLPEKVPVRTGEEDEIALYTHRAKLFRFTNGEWKERGLGDVKILKHNTTNKIRLLMRREQVLKICLNHFITKEMEFIPKDDKTWLWHAADFSEGEVHQDRFAIRFKTAEIAAEFKKALDDVQKDLQPSPVKLDALDSKEPTLAMKNFTFAIPRPGETPKSSGGQSTVSKNLFAADDDLSIVYEAKVSPEQREAALRLKLPPNFYAYLNAPNCPGCVGCEDNENNKTTCSHSLETKPASEEKSSCWGTLSFGEKEEGKKSIFQFGSSNRESPAVDNSKGLFTLPAKESVSEGDYEEDEDDDDEEDEDEGEDEEDEDDDDEVEGEEDDENAEDEEDDDDEEEFDIHDAHQTLVLEKQNFVLHKFDESSGKYDVYGDNPTLQLFQVNGCYYRICIEETDTGEMLADSYFDPSMETMFKMSSMECMWVAQDQAIDPPTMRNVMIKFASEKDLADFLAYFGENEPPEEILNSYRTSPA